MAGAVLPVLLATTAVPSAAGSGDDDRQNAVPTATQRGGAVARTPRSPGVHGVTSPSELRHTCETYRFGDVEEFAAPRTFPGGTFSGSGSVVVIGSSWATWRPQRNGLHALFAEEGRYALRFSAPVRGVLVKAEPNSFDAWPIRMTAFDPVGRPLGSFTRTIVGDSGAAFLGVEAESRPIRRVVLSAPPGAFGFAFSNLTWGPNSCR